MTVWLKTIDFRYILTDEVDLSPEQIQEKGIAIATILKNEPLFQDEDTIEGLKMVRDIGDFNTLLSCVWDECDYRCIWVRIH